MQTLFSKQPFVFIAIAFAMGIFFTGSFPLWMSLFFCSFIILFFVFKLSLYHVYVTVFLAFGLGVFSGKPINGEVESGELTFDKKQFFSKIEVIDVGHTSSKLKLLAKVVVSELEPLVDNQIHVFTDFEKEFKVGDLILVRSKISGFKRPTIPEQFDFHKYYSSKGIIAQSYVKSEQLQIIGHHISISYYVESLRGYLRNNINMLLAETEERAIIKALVVGDREDISKELKTRYVTAGIFHILAVSGLHVGIIYMLLLFFLRYVPTAGVKIFVLFCGLIFYAFLTGLSTSVIRATVMFLMFGVSEIMYKKRDSVNILFASCFLILLFQPHFIYESGFQLSVSAVLGILLFFRPIESYFRSRWWLMRKVWSLASVSIAAQILTTPLILYYFHQFPTYFIFINVIVVLLVQFVLMGGSIAAGLGESFGIGPFFASIAEKICFAINYLAKFTSNLPYSRITGLHIHEIQVFVLMAFVLCLYWFMTHKKRLFFYLAILFMITFSMFNSLRFFTYESQEYLAFHKVKNSLVIEKVKGRESYVYYDRNKIDDRQLHLALGSYWAKRNISTFHLQELKNYIFIGNQLFSVNKKNVTDYNLTKDRWRFELHDKEHKTLFSSASECSIFINK